MKILYFITMAILALSCQRQDPNFRDKKLTFAIGQHRETYKLFSCAKYDFKMAVLSKKDSFAGADYTEAVYLRNYKTARGKNIISPLLLFFINPKADKFGNFVYAGNPEYFEWLMPASAINTSSKRQKVAILKKGSLLEKKLKGLDLAILLMQAEVIETYHHLYADITLNREVETESEYKAYFDVVYHICTSKCYHPTYKFAYIFDKKNNSVFIASED